MKAFILSLLFLLTITLMAQGCNAQDDLMRLPKWEQETVNKRWDVAFAKIHEAQENLQASIFQMQLAGGSPTDTDLKDFERLSDEFIYWKAVAQIKFYQSRFNEANVATDKALEVLASISSLVDAIGKLRT